MPPESGISGFEIGPKRSDSGREPPQLFEVHSAQLAKASRTEGGKPQAHDAVVDRVGIPVDEAGIHRAVDEPDRAVVLE
jgi:hypothetical protein